MIHPHALRRPSGLPAPVRPEPQIKTLEDLDKFKKKWTRLKKSIRRRLGPQICLIIEKRIKDWKRFLTRSTRQ